jgi:DUF1680 family protein
MVFAVWGAAHAEGSNSIDKGMSVLKTFDYHGVALHDSRLKMQFDEARDFYLRIPNDDLLRGYRLRAGLPAPGSDLAGCYIGHNAFGQWMSGLARMYAATGDVACKEKAESLMRGWAECLAPDGFFFIEKDPQLPHYYYDKMVCGLLDLYVYCGTKDAAGYLERITDWAIANLDRARLYARPTGPGGGEWYTLSENLYRAYEATGNAKYRDFAEVWEYTEYWDLLWKREDIFRHPMNGGWYHAYSHCNCLSGLGAAYRVKGDAKYLDTLKNAYDFFQDSQLYATGGFGPNECLMPRPKLAEMLQETSNHFETQCGSWAVFKVCKQLITLTGDAHYGDWIEQMTLNGIGASIPMDSDGGVFYYSEYNLGGSAKKNMAPWACCTGTRPQALADIHDLIYFKDERGLYVNLFLPSEVSFDCGGAKARVEQITRFPEAPMTELRVQTDAPVVFAIKLRTPGWLAAPMKATINGEVVDVNVDAHGWATFEREWRSGDVLSVELPIALGVSHFFKNKEFPAALMWGPVALVARCGEGNPSEKFDFKDIASCLAPVGGEPLNWRVKNDAEALVRPFYEMKKGERYFMYFDPVNPITRTPRTAATFSANWTDFGGWHATPVVGSSLSYAFNGDRVSVIGQLYDDAGRYEVKVDEKVIGQIDQYGPNRGEPKRWDFRGFGEGRHVLVLTLLPDKSPESKGNYVNITAFE